VSLLLFQQVPPKAGSPVVVQESQPASGGGGGAAGTQQQQPPAGGMLFTLLPFIILVPFLFMMFRRQKKEQSDRAKLTKGDRVVSQSGLIGELVELSDGIAKVKIAPGLTVQMMANTINPMAATATSDKKDELKDLKEATAADRAKKS